MITCRPVKPTDSIPRAIWKALPPTMKVVLLANGQVAIDDEGRPIVHDEVLAVTLRDIALALAIEDAPAPANA